MSKSNEDPYVYVRTNYRVAAYIGVPVQEKGGQRRGVIVKPKRPDQYVHVLIDREKHVRNHHPLELDYLPIAGGRDALERQRAQIGSAAELIHKLSIGDQCWCGNPDAHTDLCREVKIGMMALVSAKLIPGSAEGR